jgi:hypothetical protein
MNNTNSRSGNGPAVALRAQRMAWLAELPAATRKAVLAKVRQYEVDSLLAVAKSRTGNVFPLSPGQQRLWILQQFEPESSAYNSVLAVRLKGRVSMPHLNTAFWEMEKKHEILRTSFPLVGDEPMQQVHAPEFRPLNVIDLAALQPDAVEKRVSGLLDSESSRPFNLSQLPLLRKLLVVLAEDEYLLFLTMHHILADEWSTQILVQELAELYRVLKSGSVPPLTHPQVQYADFAIWQNMRHKRGGFNEQLKYWEKALEGARELALPLDRSCVSSSDRGEVLTHALSQEATAWIHSLSRQTGATLFMVVLAAFQVFLAHWSGQSDICVGTPIANRSEPATERTIGFFLNTVVLRARIDGSMSFRNFLGQVRENTIEVIANQEAPFEMVVDRICRLRSSSSVPLIRVIFQTIPPLAFALPDTQASAVLVSRVTSKFDITLFIREMPGALLADWNYATDLFNRETIERAITRFGVLLALLASMSDSPLSEVLQRLPLVNA